MLDKREFLNRLQAELTDLTSEERREALEYYEEYFADAGEENEADVLISLGSPEQVAEQIKAGLHKADEGMFTENGYREKAENGNPPQVYGKKEEKQENAQGRDGYAGQSGGPNRDGYDGRNKAEGYRANGGGQNAYGANGGGQNAYGPNGGRQNAYGANSGGQNAYGANGGRQNAYGANGGGQNAYGPNPYGYQKRDAGKKKNGLSSGMVALLIVLGIFASPVILGLGAGLLGLAVGILGAIFGVIVAMLAVVLGLFVAGIGMFVVGFPLLFHNPFVGMFYIGGGCIMIALFLLCVLLLVAVFGRFFPWLIREVESFGKYLSRKWAGRKQKGRKTV